MNAKSNQSQHENHYGGLTHFDEGGQAHMVDVGAKRETHRVAIASGIISMKPSTLGVVMDGTAKKGDVLGIARIASIVDSNARA